MSINLIRDTQYIKKLAQSVNVTITDEASRLIAFEVEHTLRLVIQVLLVFVIFNSKECNKIYETLQS
jgi:hypothetical protein